MVRDPLGGGGASLALAGGYVLAACRSQDRATAFERYEAWMRPLVTNVQKLPPGVPRLAYPRSAATQRVFQATVRVAGTGPFRKLISKLGHVAGTGQALPRSRLPRWDSADPQRVRAGLPLRKTGPDVQLLGRGSRI